MEKSIPEENKFGRYYRIIKSAIRGDEYDFTTLNLRTAVILLAIPTLLQKEKLIPM